MLQTLLGRGSAQEWAPQELRPAGHLGHGWGPPPLIFSIGDESQNTGET